ncbi:uncharacterized protein LOC143040603 isoform X2 [Oratosquilla oratoria]|uniref:uncharacterized protein LOC143040603 isoform X2 n=1 Tax=Oratosquilla oratoria TaxID=337810 RepID=UPI003F76BFFE
MPFRNANTLTVVVICAVLYRVGALLTQTGPCETVSATNQDFLRFARALEDLASTLKESSQATRNHQETLTRLLSVLSDQSTSRCQPREDHPVRQGSGWHPTKTMIVDAAAKEEDFERLSQSVATLMTQFRDLRRFETPQPAPHCPSPYERIGKDCVYIHTEDIKPWHDARAHCKSQGGDLAVPYDVGLLRKHIDESFKLENFWVGGSDLETTKGDFRWFNGSKVDAGWTVRRVPMTGGPDAKSCVTLTPYSLDNLPCKWSLYFVCSGGVSHPHAHRNSG